MVILINWYAILSLGCCEDISSYRSASPMEADISGDAHTENKTVPTNKTICNKSEFPLETGKGCSSDKVSKIELKCIKCNKKFNNRKRFLKHLQHYIETSKVCNDCQQTFNNSFAFTYHKELSLCGQTSKIIKCKLCSKKLFGRSQFSNHMVAHRRNQCTTCRCHFSTRKHLETHNFTVHNTSLSKDFFRCDTCEKTFSQRRSLLHHYKISHTGNTHVCEVCQETFDLVEHLEAHKTIHKSKTFQCPKCDEQFVRQKAYLIHLNEHNKYKCVDCDVGFSKKKAATKHASAGHVVEGLHPQQCEECGRMFSSRGSLRFHMASHHSGNIFPCEKCKITFKEERLYLSHLETNEHIGDGVPKQILACDECSKTFLNKNNLRMHKKRVHNPDLKELCCILCSYKTTLSGNLKRHMDLHTQKPQFICDKCAAKFQTKSALQEHVAAIHSKHKEFSCDKCGNQFARRSDLNRHLTNTHSDTAQYVCHCNSKYKSLSSLKRHQLMAHDSVDVKQNRLSKLFPVEVVESIKKSKKGKGKSKKNTQKSDDASLSSKVTESAQETDAVVMQPENQPGELIDIPYSMNFPQEIMGDKSQPVYAQGLDMNNYQVVHLDTELEKPIQSVLVNVRNVFSKSASNCYIDTSIEPNLVSNLGGSLTDISVASRKQDLLASLQEYIIPNDLNFLNV